ncbi:MAG TPA: sugar phosphate nucleotidyltransferase, partial [Chloroflexota bacterium]|nr:sugar phosphate nucleotidyltransferase [Chloroflexota bacterium]
SGDALTDFDLKGAIDAHKKTGAIATLVLYRVPNPLEYGVVVTAEDGRIRQFQEKPSWGEVVTDTINTGIYVLDPKIFEYYEPRQVFDFSKDLFPLLLKEGLPIYGYVAGGYWTDVGSIEEYVRATRDVLAGKVEIDWGKATERDGIWREEGAYVDGSAELHAPLYLGHDVKIGPRVIVHGPSVIRDNTVVNDRAHIDRSIVWRNSFVGPQSEIRGSILGTECNVQANAVVFEGAVISDQTIVGRGAIVQPNVKIWPHKEVEAGAVVSASIIWGSAGRRVLFGRHGVSGLINVDFTPEALARLGSAYGSTLRIGCDVTVTRDLAVPSRMLGRALTSGLPSAGVNVLDLAAVPTPVGRFYTCVTDAVGGLHVGVSTYDRTLATIRFFDQQGMDLPKSSQRKVESAYFREDFRRAHIDDIGETSYAPGVIERYTDAFLDRVDREAIARSGYRLVVDYSLGTTSDILPPILRALGAHVVDLNAGRGQMQLTRSVVEREAAVSQLGTIVSALRFDLGAIIGPNGEELQIVDGRGQVISPMQVLAALACLVYQRHEGAKVAVPVDAPTVFEQLAEQYDGKVLRSRLDPEALMTAAQKDVMLAGDGRGGIIFPALHPSFDAMFSLVSMLQLLSNVHATLQEVVAGLPAWHVQETNVAAPWDKKGRVMRLLGEQYRERRVRTLDGIKIQLGQEWVLVLPDPDEPQFHLVAEANTDREARALVDKYAGIVSGLQQ